MKETKKKPNRNGVFVGGYVPQHIKDFVQRRAKIQHKTVSQILKEILVKEMSESLTKNP